MAKEANAELGLWVYLYENQVIETWTDSNATFLTLSTHIFVIQHFDFQRVILSLVHLFILSFR